MSELTTYQELATWAGGIAAGVATLAVSFSKIARGYSADRQAVSNDTTSNALYERLRQENARIDERNKALELKNDTMLVRLSKLEIVHMQLQSVESQNKTLKESVIRKDAQLLALLRQQRADREEWTLKLKDLDKLNANLKRQLETIQSTLLRNVEETNNTNRRITDLPPTVQDENNV